MRTLTKRYFAQIFAAICLILLPSCGSIQVDKGPFEIESDLHKINEKQKFLQGLSAESFSDERPNIILILADDLSKYDVSLYDSSGVYTPNLQKLADEGVKFTNAFTSSPVCSPSRAALFTGRYQQRFGFERQPMNRYSRNRLEYFFVDHFMNVEPMRLMNPMADVPLDQIEKQGIPDEEILLSELLQHAGYATGISGKWHLGNAEPFRPNIRGFQQQYGFYEAFTLYSPEGTDGIIEHRHDYFANKHIWKQQREGSSAIRMNDSIIEEKEYLTFAIARESVRFIEEHENQPFFLVSAFNAPHTPFQVPRKYYEMFSHVEDHNKRVYFGMIAALDEAIGTIMRASEGLNNDRETIIFFASDNGGACYTEATDNGPLAGGKFTQFEGGINIPMIMKYEGIIPPGTVYERQVALFDVFTTALNLCGIQWIPTRKLDGIDLVEKVQHPEDFSHEYLYWRTDYNKTIRSEAWKLIWNERDDQHFLFNLSKSNAEKDNVAEEFPEVVKNLKEKFREWEKEMANPLWPGVMEYRFEINGIETWWAI